MVLIYLLYCYFWLLYRQRFKLHTFIFNNIVVLLLRIGEPERYYTIVYSL